MTLWEDEVGYFLGYPWPPKKGDDAVKPAPLPTNYEIREAVGGIHPPQIFVWSDSLDPHGLTVVVNMDRYYDWDRTKALESAKEIARRLNGYPALLEAAKTLAAAIEDHDVLGTLRDTAHHARLDDLGEFERLICIGNNLDEAADDIDEALAKIKDATS